MIPRNMRLSRAQFASATQGKRAQSAHFSVTTRRNGQGGLAAVISKKVAKRSVDRHLLKRRILAVLRGWHDPELSVIVFARSGSTSLSFKALSEELNALLKDSR